MYNLIEICCHITNIFEQRKRRVYIYSSEKRRSTHSAIKIYRLNDCIEILYIYCRLYISFTNYNIIIIIIKLFKQE